MTVRIAYGISQESKHIENLKEIFATAFWGGEHPIYNKWNVEQTPPTQANDFTFDRQAIQNKIDGMCYC